MTLNPPTVVNIKRGESYDLYIGRGSPDRLGNPTPIDHETSREEAIRQFELYARRTPRIMAWIPKMTGLRLGCSCHPLACHGDVYVKLWWEWYRANHNSGDRAPAR
jgi:hypothetical protein